MDNAKWYFTHETEEDRLWYHIFFSMCRKFGVSWPKASKEQKTFIGEIIRVNYERGGKAECGDAARPGLF